MLIFVTRKWGGLGLAVLAQRQGSEVVAAYDYTNLEDEDLQPAKLCGNGMVEKVPLHAAIKHYTRKGALWVFDGNEMPEYADRLRRLGELVIGTSALSAKMEDDRDHASKIAKQAGMQLPETEEFTDYRAGIDFLKKNPTESYVCKPYEADPEATFVPQQTDEPKLANKELQEYLFTLSLHDKKKPRFILQKTLHGTEANFELWIHDGKPIAAFCDLESKRKLTGDIGENIGCAGDYVFKLPIGAKGVARTVAGYLKLPEVKRHTGSIDANVMVVGESLYFLENCFRFGYNAYPALFQGLANESVEKILQAWVAGKDPQGMFKSGFASTLTLVYDHPKEGAPVLVSDMSSFYPYSVYKDEGVLVTTGGKWSDVGCVVSHANLMEAAGNKCLRLAEGIALPDKGYRIDLASDNLPTLPIRRYRALQTAGLLKA